jgi:hypothetical protein
MRVRRESKFHDPSLQQDCGFEPGNPDENHFQAGRWTALRGITLSPNIGRDGSLFFWPLRAKSKQIVGFGQIE